MLLTPGTLVAQSRSFANDQLFEFQREKFMRTTSDPYDDIDGSPYYFDEFLDGVVYLHNGSSIEGQYRYDIYKNQFQFKDDESVLVFAYPDSIARIDIDGNVFRYLIYYEEPMMKKSYFVEVVNGYCNLFRKHNKVFYEAKPPKPYQEPEPAAIRDDKVSYYFQIGDEKPVKIGKKKEFVSICGEFAPQIEEYLQQNKISLKKEADLKSLFQYLNGLYSN